MYQVKFETSKGDFTVEVHPEWAPLGAAQFKEIVEDGVFNEARFFRVIEGFMVQFGIAGDPAVSAKWRNKQIKDDPTTQSNTRGMITFATAGPNTRTSQVFINFGDNSFLDNQGFAPFGKVTEGMEVVDALYAGYGEGAPQGRGPGQGQVQSKGNEYLKADFPELDYIKQATVVE
ncbi:MULTISPECIES: peptidylprolyl isomerase [Thalassoglobus]|uniref:Peptidyl-prolyl cis-trans isomerase n=1 Tax=Thalassoglobus polymorphus TaxID=2527994 RepID=A0A517QVD7_9PLAN|nr:peptidylprolyl isomerase [Thalassoglobus polymorphus]QDT35564.1 Peptidyl-prolyl cis-trans isomerase A precursor [Thalassoglobus polymorphus]